MLDLIMQGIIRDSADLGGSMKSESKTLKIQPIESVPQAIGGLSKEDLKILKAPFPRERLGVKVQTFNRERNRALLVLYLQHTEVQDRLEEVDPAWNMEVLKEDKTGDTYYVRMRLTLKGVSRENVGEGNDPKAAYSDALKRCAMFFGVGRYLYDSAKSWVDYQESRDRYRRWTIDDFEHADKTVSKTPDDNSKQNSGPQAVEKPENRKKQVRPREQLNRTLMSLYRPYLARYPDTKFTELLGSKYGVSETRLMTVEQLEDLVHFMEDQLQTAA
jgi:hypothetical protein